MSIIKYCNNDENVKSITQHRTHQVGSVQSVEHVGVRFLLYDILP